MPALTECIRKEDTMTRYYRIQPAGRSLRHRSEGSSGDARGLHVFEAPWQTFNTDVGLTLAMAQRVYGNEVVTLDAPAARDNGDTEGVEVDGVKARVVARYAWGEWMLAVSAAAGIECPRDAEEAFRALRSDPRVRQIEKL